MKLIMVLLSLGLLSACSKEASTSPSLGQTDGFAQVSAIPPEVPTKLHGEWSTSQDRIDARLGRISTGRRFKFKDTGEYTLEHFAHYSLINYTYTRVESGTYLITNGNIQFNLMSSTCPAAYPETMQFIAENGFNTLEFRIPMTDGMYSSVELTKNRGVIVGTNVSLDTDCSGFR